MTKVAVIGCGVVGAMIAYELSLIPGLSVTVLDRQLPAQASTGAALGVLMGAISQKVKGRSWQLRQASMQRYETLVAELGHCVPYNRQGIVMLCFDESELLRWQNLIEIRQTQGWPIELWDVPKLRSRCPQIQHPDLVAAIYSPCDRQIDPTALTLALVEAAKQRGVRFEFDRPVLSIRSAENHAQQIVTASGNLSVNWVVVAAGLGSTELTRSLDAPLDIRPVLGQALKVQLPDAIGDAAFQPVITGDDVHLVPLGQHQYWIGATVELPDEAGVVAEASPDRLERVFEDAIAFCPALTEAKILQTWSGLRPRPHNQPAPVIGLLSGYDNVLLATGHYRNGVLLAPVTAAAVCEAIAAPAQQTA
ncbi:FAD-binding oxidoreductase [Microcoleus sp. FACHB-1515]|uniref:NAD(P)/FAD-dependent oxidoreductase n=1 Tax=Cyanophyceae TaxID=3028117 RepID=UPI001685C16C|nr:FAD-dependent oxidoreductase [Microcoleus sp. FACHB-1515]MBD2090523.1 FAD-binding oxidoreductase [Microcoleus sp. FACHB-1515]